MITKAKTGIKAENCICKVSAVADSQLLNTVLYSKTGDPETEYFDNYSVEQDNLYDGDEMYIRIMGCGGGSTDSIDSILQKIASGEVLLKDIAQIKQGIVSGADKYTDAHQAKYGLNHPKGKGIFVLSKDALDELHLPATEVSKYVKEVYKNSQISRYHIAYQEDLYVFYMTKAVAVDDAPNIIEYLEQFKPILASKREAVTGKMPWYSLNWARDKAIFEDPEKIVNSRRAKSNIFALETKKCYEQSDIMISVIEKKYQIDFPAKYVLGVLNSKLYYIWLKNRGKLKGELLELYGKPLEEIPLKMPTANQRDSIISLVDEMINSGGKNDEVSHKIDMLVYQIYSLTDKEIELVEQEAR